MTSNGTLSQGEDLQVLVAEDKPLNAQLAVAILGFAESHVTVANNGLKALQAIQSTEFQLVLIDVHMPGMSGIEVTSVPTMRGFG